MSITRRDPTSEAHAAAARARAAGLPDDEVINAALFVVLRDLDAMLYPERHPGYDPDHIYWDGHDPDDPNDQEPFQWSPDTIAWVGQWLNQRIEEVT